MSEQPPGPIKVTDKREQARQAAEERRTRIMAGLEPEETVAVITTPADDQERDIAAEATKLVELIDEAEQLKAVGREAPLTEEQGARLLTIQGQIDDLTKPPEGVVEGVSAFYVVIHHDGSVQAITDCNTVLQLDREATFDDMYGGCSIVLRDIDAAITSRNVIMGIGVASQAMVEKRAVGQQLAAMDHIGSRAGGRRKR